MTDILNLNTAKKDELTTLPGVGPVMADRIIASRPYETPESLLEVNGIGETFFERLKPHIKVEAIDEPGEEEDVIYLEAETAPEETDEEESQEKVEGAQVSEDIPAWEGTESEETDTLEEAPEEEDVTEESESVAETIAREKAIVPVAEEETSKEEPKKKTRHVTWGQAILISVISSFIAFCLAVLLSIGIFGSLNNGLRYATLDQALNLNRQVESLNSDIGLLVEDLDGLRARLDNLEGISGRVGELELEAEQLSSDIASAIDGIEEIRTQIEEFSESADSFEQFLTGLGDLLDNLIEQPEVP